MKIALSALLMVGLLQAQTPAPQSPLPTFRTGVDIVQLDVTVLDKDRHPVPGLTADDFTILEKGKPQPIVAFSAVDVPAPAATAAPWIRDAPLDVVSNAGNRRLVSIIMDDAYAKFEPDVTKRAKQIARTAIDQLGPGDLAAVVFTFLGRAQNFTADRSQLIQAVESYSPKVTGLNGGPAVCDLKHRSCDVEALQTVASTLLTAPAGRKIVILITGGRAFTFGEIGVASSRSEGFQLVRLFSDLQRANVTVYAYDAHGLEADGSMIAKESMYSFAESTGGRAVAFTNDPAPSVVDAFRESSSYYFLGFRTAGSNNEKEFHKIEVRVNRPGVQVHTRNGYYPPAKNAPAATVNGIPSGDLPIYVTTAPVAVSGRREAEMILATRIGAPDAATTPAQVALTTTAYDSQGKPHGTLRQTMTITKAGATAEPDLPGHFPLKPGRYMLTVAAAAEGRSGSVFVDVDVPDFAKDALSASGLILQRRAAAPIHDKFISDLVPIVPTTHRQFLASDEVSMFLRIYQGGKGKIVPVRMTARVRNERNAIASNHEGLLEVANFSESRAADFAVSLPLDHLSPGEYLLEVDAQSGARHVTRTARFEVVATK